MTFFVVVVGLSLVSVCINVVQEKVSLFYMDFLNKMLQALISHRPIVMRICNSRPFLAVHEGKGEWRRGGIERGDGRLQRPLQIFDAIHFVREWHDKGIVK